VKPYAAITRWLHERRRRAMLRDLRIRSSGVLRDLLEMTCRERRDRLQLPEVREALKELGTDEAVSWLETVLESPVVEVWGSTLYELEPRIEHLERWVSLSKEHALAAVDALLLFGPSSFYNDRTPPRLPSGADNARVNALINDALSRYDNPRLRVAEKQIRHVWTIRAPPREPVQIADEMRAAAEALLRSDSRLMRRWIEELQTSPTPPKTQAEVWVDLILFGDRNDLLVWTDWSFDPADVVWRLRKTSVARDISLDWLEFERFEGTTEEFLTALGAEVAQCGRALVLLDSGGSDMALAIIHPEKLPFLRAVADSCLESPEAVCVA